MPVLEWPQQINKPGAPLQSVSEISFYADVETKLQQFRFQANTDLYLAERTHDNYNIAVSESVLNTINESIRLWKAGR